VLASACATIGDTIVTTNTDEASAAIDERTAVATTDMW
jgi:hypothetical protein